MRLIKRNSLINVVHHSAVDYPVPSNISYFWNFGILALVCLVVQLVSGIFLAMHYVPNVDLAFVSVEHIMRDVNYGWLLRYIHANGASMFFVVVYLHIFRGIFYSSYSKPRELLWCIGVIIFLLMILTAFMGYVLPWGQMSFWAATVIINLASAIPFIGNEIVLWLWGGFSVDNATLNRFFSLHYLFPFIITALVVIHIIFLHETKSSNPLGTKNYDNVPMSPYFTIKDLFITIVFFVVFFIFVYFMPNYLGHPDNYIPANPMVTPAHIVPEWYFLPFYAILRSVPDKLGGVVLMVSAILILLFIPFLSKINLKSFSFRPLNNLLFWFFFFNWFILGWIGGSPIEYPFFEIGQLSAFFYFFYFFFTIFYINWVEIILKDDVILNKKESIFNYILSIIKYFYYIIKYRNYKKVKVENKWVIY